MVDHIHAGSSGVDGLVSKNAVLASDRIYSLGATAYYYIDHYLDGDEDILTSILRGPAA
jgi:hypothetical protein